MFTWRLHRVNRWEMTADCPTTLLMILITVSAPISFTSGMIFLVRLCAYFQYDNKDWLMLPTFCIFVGPLIIIAVYWGLLACWRGCKKEIEDKTESYSTI